VEGHITADDVEEAIRGALPDSDVVVHLEPQSENLDPRDRALAAALAEPAVREVHDIVLYEEGNRFNVSLHLKLSPDMPLRAAHQAAERVERAIAADPDVASVQTHLEPLEQPQSSATRGREDAAELAGLQGLVLGLTGHEPLQTKLIRAARGQVLFLTVAVAAELSLSEAHELAGRLEEEIRRSHPHLIDVVVHTEPLER
jgi:divalent metal cation (Fe/Co/Zn/Cd) transporter